MNDRIQDFSFINLDRPLIFFDLETTGLDSERDNILELFALKIYPDGLDVQIHHYFNPGKSIPREATGIHGITNDFIANKPAFRSLSADLSSFFENADLAGYNLKKFDIPMLIGEFKRCNLAPLDLSTIRIIDCFQLFREGEKRSLSAAVKFYCDEDHENAHSAKADVLATIKILQKQLMRYEHLQPNPAFLHTYLNETGAIDFSGHFIRDEKGDTRINFGKYDGALGRENVPYLRWMLTANFTQDTKLVAQKIIDKAKWIDEIKYWLRKEQIANDLALVSGLYECIKSKKEDHPFTLNTEGNQVFISYNKQVPSTLTLTCHDHVSTMVEILEKMDTQNAVQAG